MPKMQLGMGDLLKAGFRLKLLDHEAQTVLLWGSYGQKLHPDAGGAGPAHGGIVDQDRLRFAWNM